MPLEALSAKARLMVPVGAIDSRWLFLMPWVRICFAQGIRQPLGEPAGQVLFRIEQREGPLLLGEPHRGGVGRVAHALRHPRREGPGGVRVVAQPQHHQGVSQPQEPQPDAALVLRLGPLLRQRPVGRLQHVVEHSHGHADHGLEQTPVEARGGRERVQYEPGEVDAPQAAAAIVRQPLFGAVMQQETVPVEGVDSGNRHIENGFCLLWRYLGYFINK